MVVLQTQGKTEVGEGRFQVTFLHLLPPNSHGSYFFSVVYTLACFWDNIFMFWTLPNLWMFIPVYIPLGACKVRLICPKNSGQVTGMANIGIFHTKPLSISLWTSVIWAHTPFCWPGGSSEPSLARVQAAPVNLSVLRLELGDHRNWRDNICLPTLLLTLLIW